MDFGYKKNLISYKIWFTLKEKIFWFKLRLKYNYDNIIFNLKYLNSPMRIFSNLNFKAFLFLLLFFLLIIFLQTYIYLKILSPSIGKSSESEIKEYAKSYILEHSNIKKEIEKKISEKIIFCSEVARKISVPFHLNRIIYVQKELEKIYSNDKEAKKYITFNHLGRILNIVPFDKRYWQHIATYTPYMKYILEETPKNPKTSLYFYLDNPLIISKYDLKEDRYISRHKFYNMEPLQLPEEFEDSKKTYIHKFLKPNEIFIDSKNLKIIESKVPYILFYAPIFNQVNKWIGCFAFCIDINKIFKNILWQNREIFSSVVLNNKGIIIYHFSTENIGEYIGDLDLIKKIKDSNKELINIKGEIYLKSNINGTDWILLSKLNRGIFFKRIKNLKTLKDLILLFLIEIIILILIILIFNRKVTRKIERISYNIKKLLEGKPEKSVNFGKDYQLKILEDRFNKLLERTAGYIIFGKTVPYEIVSDYIDKGLEKIEYESKKGTVLYIRIKNIENLRKTYYGHEFESIFNRLINDVEIVVTKYKGFIEFMGGDAFIAIFGIPFNHYDHIQNSFEAAKSIWYEIRKLNKKINIPLELSININTGEISFSQFRSNYGRIFVPIGETIKKAIQFESITKPGTISVAEEVYKNLSPKIKFSIATDIYIHNESEKIYVSKLKE